MATTQKFVDNNVGLPTLWTRIVNNFSRYAFKTFHVGSTDIVADSKDDTLTLAAGDNVTLTPNASTDTITIAAQDTHHTAYLRAGASGGTANAATTSGNTYLNLVENGSNRSGVKLVPGDNTSVTSDASGNVTISSEDTNYVATKTSVGSAAVQNTVDVDDITAWSAGSRPSVSISEGILTFEPGSVPTLNYTGRSIPVVSVTSKEVISDINSTSGDAAEAATVSALTASAIDSVCV